jgi:hypothetical protein
MMMPSLVHDLIPLDNIHQMNSELARLQKDWDAPIYVFFKPLPSIQYIQNRKAHVFECAASQCHCQTRFVGGFLDMTDARSTSNLRHHAKMCWSNEAVEAADGTQDVVTHVLQWTDSTDSLSMLV